MARTPRPTALKMIAGTRPNRINHDEPEPEEGVPVCPSSNPRVQAVWDYTVEQLKTMRTITMADRDALHVYCEQVIVHRDALAQIKHDGQLLNSPHGPLRHPSSIILKESAALIKSFGAAFGLTPASRTAIKVGDQRSKPAVQDASRLLSG